MLTANGATGITHDFFCYDSTGKVWNGSAFVTWADVDYATYRVTATERGTSGTFTGTAPAGTSQWEMRVRAGTLAASYVVWAEKGPRQTRTTVTDTTSTLTEDVT